MYDLPTLQRVTPMTEAEHTTSPVRQTVMAFEQLGLMSPPLLSKCETPKRLKIPDNQLIEVMVKKNFDVSTVENLETPIDTGIATLSGREKINIEEELNQFTYSKAASKENVSY